MITSLNIQNSFCLNLDFFKPFQFGLGFTDSAFNVLVVVCTIFKLLKLLLQDGIKLSELFGEVLLDFLGLCLSVLDSVVAIFVELFLNRSKEALGKFCLLYTSDAADE